LIKDISFYSPKCVSNDGDTAPTRIGRGIGRWLSTWARRRTPTLGQAGNGAMPSGYPYPVVRVRRLIIIDT